ncbi:MAG: imidazole glycerol phosphate synthase subunit HisH [Candidatus Omnitrophica bacterium]|nr:imidazole glycerol phosphate synthase subunit HisH [Candidatus Omnitrophota bacterium]
MIAIIDYGMGNLRSVQKAIELAGGETCVTQDAAQIRGADKVVLPGVGAMRPAMEQLKRLELIPEIESAVKAGKPFLGICLGYQLLFQSSDEGGVVAGLGILSGPVVKFASLKIPQMGWNQIELRQKDCPLYQGVPEGSYVYFCHSYHPYPADNSIIATTTKYGMDFASSVCRGRLFGVQFHPEKSQGVGKKILENFVKL